MSKKSQSLSNPNETWWKWLTHETIVFIMFHQNWTKIVDFLITANFGTCAVFSCSDFIRNINKEASMLLSKEHWSQCSLSYQRQAALRTLLFGWCVLLRYRTTYLALQQSSVPEKRCIRPHCVLSYFWKYLPIHFELEVKFHLRNLGLANTVWWKWTLTLISK